MNRHVDRCFRCRTAKVEYVEIGFTTPDDRDGTIGTALLCLKCEDERPRQLSGTSLRRWLRGL